MPKDPVTDDSYDPQEIQAEEEEEESTTSSQWKKRQDHWAKIATCILSFMDPCVQGSVSNNEREFILAFLHAWVRE